MLSRSRCRLRAIRSEWTIEERKVPVLIGRVTSRLLERLSAAEVDNAPGKKKGGGGLRLWTVNFEWLHNEVDAYLTHLANYSPFDIWSSHGSRKSLRARFFRLFSGGYVGNTHIVCVRVMYFDNSKFFPSRFSQHQKDNRRRWVWVGMMCCI